MALQTACQLLGLAEKVFVKPVDDENLLSKTPDVSADQSGKPLEHKALTADYAIVDCWLRDRILVQLSVAAVDRRGCSFLQGEVLWGSGFVLASWLEASGFVLDQRVLELGSGLGLGGLAAAALGGNEVVLTDRPSIVLDSLHANVAMNIMPHKCIPCQKVHVAPLDWLEDESNDLGHFDVILGSDIMYDQFTPRALLATLSRHLKHGGRFACVDPCRGGSARGIFSKLVQELDGWEYSETSLHEACQSALDIVRDLVPLPPSRRAGLAAALGIPAGSMKKPCGVALRDLVMADAPYTLVLVSRVAVTSKRRPCEITCSTVGTSFSACSPPKRQRQCLP